MTFFKTMKIFDFFLENIWGKWSEPEPEPKFLTSWSRSRTKMDRLRNTGLVKIIFQPKMLYKKTVSSPHTGNKKANSALPLP
jgi:hypothetical protein